MESNVLETHRNGKVHTNLNLANVQSAAFRPDDAVNYRAQAWSERYVTYRYSYRKHCLHKHYYYY